MDAKTAAREELARERNAGMWTDDDGFEIERPAEPEGTPATNE